MNVLAPFFLVCALLSADLAAATERLVVTGSRMPRAYAEISENLSVITAADIQRHQYRTLTEALAALAGLHVSTAGGAGAQTSVFIRGAESDHVLVMIDGVEVGDPAVGGLFEFSNLALSDVERIEVARGGHGAEYGSHALGGVIHIITRSGRRDARASVERGSFNSRRVSASFGRGGADGASDFLLGASYFKTDGESFTPRRLRAGERENDAHRNANVNLRFSFPVTRTLQAAFSSGYVEAESEYDAGAGENNLSQSSSYAKRSGLVLSGDYFDGFWQPAWRFNRYVRDFASGVPGGEAHYRGERLNASWSNALHFSQRLKAVVGAASELERTRIGGAFNARARTRTVYAELRYAPADDFHLGYSWRNDDPDDFSSKRSGRLGVTWMPGGGDWLLRADYATGFKAPSLSDRFRSFPDFNFYGNPGLEPETNRHWQAGFEHHSGDWRLGATYFNNRIRNLIESGTIDDRSTLVNRRGARIEGLESFAVWQTPAFSMRLDHSVMRPYGDDHRRLLRRPGRKLSWQAAFSPLADIDFAFRLNYIGPRSDLAGRLTSARKMVAGYTLAHLSARKEIFEGVDFFARVNNLFNRRHEPVAGFAGSGIEFHAGFSFNL